MTCWERGRRMVSAAVVAAVLAGCGSGINCPNDLPASCPSPVPSYQTTVSSIINVRCTSCHSPGGQAATWPFQTYQDVYVERSTVLNQVYSCNMPLGGPALPEQERQDLLGWLVCGAPQN